MSGLPGVISVLTPPPIKLSIALSPISFFLTLFSPPLYSPYLSILLSPVSLCSTQITFPLHSFIPSPSFSDLFSQPTSIFQPAFLFCLVLCTHLDSPRSCRFFLLLFSMRFYSFLPVSPLSFYSNSIFYIPFLKSFSYTPRPLLPSPLNHHPCSPVALSSSRHAQPTISLLGLRVPSQSPLCFICVVRPYEMRWYKWHFMGMCSTTRPNTAGNHKSHCLLCMPLLMCSIWFNARDRWGRIGGEAAEVRMRGRGEVWMEIKGIKRQG